MSGSDENTIDTDSPDVLYQIDRICRQFEERWHREDLSIEQCLAQVGEKEQAILFRELFLLEVAFKRNQGQVLIPEQYRKRFPQQAQAIDSMLEEALSADCSPTEQTLGPNVTSKQSDIPALPGFRLEKKLGAGSFADVYMAQQERPLRKVAVKILRDPQRLPARAVERFLTEADAIARLDHPGIVQLYAVNGIEEGAPFLVLELCEGGSLAARLKQKPFTAVESAQMVLLLAQAMAGAHQKGVVHRDLKPDNVLLTPEGAPKITDFGLAKLLDEDQGTRAGTIMGTLAYMPPEQVDCRLDRIGPGTDVYALGIILYELLTGRPPFEGGTFHDIQRQILTQLPVPPSRLQPQVPRDLEMICLRCLEKETYHRYGNGSALAEDLGRFLQGRPIDLRQGGQARLERELYQKNLAQAEQEWHQGNRPRMGPLLYACASELRGWEWNCLRELQDREPLTLDCHSDVVYALAFSPDGRRMATASDDQTIQIHEVPTGKLLQKLSGHTDQIYVLSFGPNGEKLVAASQDKAVVVWDLQTAKPQYWRGHSDVVVGVTWSRGGKYIASASDDTTVRIWDATSGEASHTLTGHKDMVNTVAFSPDEKYLASGSYDNTVKIWNVSHGSLLRTLPEARSFIWDLDFSPDGRLLACGGGDHQVRIYDAATGQEIHVLEGHTGVIWSVAFSPDGKRLASSSWDKTIRIWDPQSGQEMLSLNAHRDSINCVGYSPDGRYLASASDDRTVKLWDGAPRTDPEQSVLLTYRKHEGAVLCVTFSSEGEQVLSAGTDRTVQIWNSGNGSAQHSLCGHSTLVTAIALSPNGSQLASVSGDKDVRLWDLESGKCRVLRGHRDRIYGVAFSPDGRYVVTGAWDRTVMVWDLEEEKEPWILLGHTNWVWDVAVSCNGLISSASTDCTVRLWDAQTKKQSNVLRGHDLKVQGVAFHPLGSHLASASGDTTVRIWDCSTGDSVKVLKGHSERVYKVAYHPGGRYLASASEDQTVRIWDVEAGKEAMVLHGHTQQVNNVAFSPNGRQLASASEDGTVKLWCMKAL